MSDFDYDITDYQGEPRPTVTYARPQDFKARRSAGAVLMLVGVGMLLGSVLFVWFR